MSIVQPKRCNCAPDTGDAKIKQTHGTHDHALLGHSVDILGWKICCNKQPILGSEERDTWSKDLGFSLPEMVFGENTLVFEHKESGLIIHFNARDALSMCERSTELKVAASKHWFQSKKGTIERERVAPAAVNVDWTFSTLYQGSLAPASVLVERTTETLDMEMLKAPEPILFYQELVLFEDELADNGCALFTARLRVMPKCFFLLVRFFLRVDEVLFRLYDTRFFHKFGQPYLLRETLRKESTYAQLQSRLPSDSAKLGQADIMAPLLAVKELFVDRICLPSAVDAAATATAAAAAANSADVVSTSADPEPSPSPLPVDTPLAADPA